MGRSTRCLALLAFAWCACGDDAARGSGPNTGGGTDSALDDGLAGRDAAPTGRVDAGDAAGGGMAGDEDILRADGYVPLASTEDALGRFTETIGDCAARTPPNPNAHVYYVAMHEPGADNDACDGSAPTDEGSGKCPFRDFDSPRIRTLLVGTKNVRVEIRTGHYRLIPSAPFRTPTSDNPFIAEGIVLEGVGTSDAERVVLAAHASEDVVLDGEGHIRETVRASGEYTLIEGLTIVNGGGYSVELRGGAHHRVRCNRIGWSGSDALKGDGGSAESEVLHNEFTDWSSQAIDNTDVHGWRIEGNVFHHPRLEDANATGAKFGSSDVLLTGNVFHHTRGLSMGGTSSEHEHAYEAMRVIARGNLFHDVVGVVAKLYACVDCEFVDNDVRDSDGGLYLEDQSSAGPSGCPGGCGPSRGMRFATNRFRNLDGGDTGEGEANTFAGLFPSEAAGFTAVGNVYCVPLGESANFWYGEPLDFAAWQAATGTDADSGVHVDTDAACQGW